MPSKFDFGRKHTYMCAFDPSDLTVFRVGILSLLTGKYKNIFVALGDSDTIC